MTLGYGPILPMFDTAMQNDIFRQWTDRSFKPIDISQCLANCGFNVNNNNNNNFNSMPQYTPAGPQFNVDRALGKLNLKQLRELQAIEKEIRNNIAAQTDKTKTDKELEDLRNKYDELVAKLAEKENEYLELGENDSNPSDGNNEKFDLYTNISPRELIHMNNLSKAADKFEEKLKRLQEELDMLTMEKKSYDACRIQAPQSLMEQYEKLRSNFSMLITNRDKKLTSLSSYVKAAIKGTGVARGTIGTTEATERGGMGTSNAPSDKKTDEKQSSQNAKQAPASVKDDVLKLVNDFDTSKEVENLISDIKTKLDSYNPALQPAQREDALKAALEELSKKIRNGNKIYEPGHVISEYIKSKTTNNNLGDDAKKFAKELISANISGANSFNDAVKALRDYVNAVRKLDSESIPSEKKAAVNEYIKLFAQVLKSKMNNDNKKEIEKAVSDHGTFQLIDGNTNSTFAKIFEVTQVENPTTDSTTEEQKEINTDAIIKEFSGLNDTANILINANLIKNLNECFSNKDTAKEKNKKLANKIANSKVPEKIHKMVESHNSIAGRPGSTNPDTAFKTLLENVIKYCDLDANNDKLKQMVQDLIKLETWKSKQAKLEDKNGDEINKKISEIRETSSGTTTTENVTQTSSDGSNDKVESKNATHAQGEEINENKQLEKITTDYMNTLANNIMVISGNYSSAMIKELGIMTKNTVLELEKLITDDSSAAAKEMVYKNIIAILMLKSRVVRKKFINVSREDLKKRLDKYIEEIDRTKQSPKDFNDLKFKTTVFSSPNYSEIGIVSSLAYSQGALEKLPYSDIDKFEEIKGNLRKIWFN